LKLIDISSNFVSKNINLQITKIYTIKDSNIINIFNNINFDNSNNFNLDNSNNLIINKGLEINDYFIIFKLISNNNSLNNIITKISIINFEIYTTLYNISLINTPNLFNTNIFYNLLNINSVLNNSYNLTKINITNNSDISFNNNLDSFIKFNNISSFINNTLLFNVFNDFETSSFNFLFDNKTNKNILFSFYIGLIKSINTNTNITLNDVLKDYVLKITLFINIFKYDKINIYRVYNSTISLYQTISLSDNIYNFEIKNNGLYIITRFDENINNNKFINIANKNKILYRDQLFLEKIIRKNFF